MRRMHIVASWLALGGAALCSCSPSSNARSETSQALDAETCGKLAIDINQIVDTNGASLLNDTYAQSVKKTGARTVRIDVKSGFADSLLTDVQNRIDPDFDITLAIGEDAVGIPFPPEMATTCGSSTSCDTAVNNWFLAYDEAFVSAIERFFCAGISINYVEVFAKPNLPTNAGPRMRPERFATLLRRAENARDEGLSGVSELPGDCDNANNVSMLWQNIELVSGPLDASGFPDSDPSLYFSSVLNALPIGDPFPAHYIGIDMSSIDVPPNEPFHFASVVEKMQGEFNKPFPTDPPTARQFLSGKLSPGNFHVSFGWNSALLAAEEDERRIKEAFDFAVDPNVVVAYWLSLVDESPSNAFGLFTNTFGEKSALNAFREHGCKVEIDLVIVIDTTGSMGNDIDAAIQRVSDIVNAIFDQPNFNQPNFNPRVALIDFRDFPDNEYGLVEFGDYPCRVRLDFTGTRGAVIDAISALKPIGHGGGTLESVYSGMMAALQNPTHKSFLQDIIAAPGASECQGDLAPWRATANKAILLIGDAPPHAEHLSPTHPDAPAAIFRVGCLPPNDTEIAAEDVGEPYTCYRQADVIDATKDPFIDVDCDVVICSDPGLPTLTHSLLADEVLQVPPVRIYALQISPCSRAGNCVPTIPEFVGMAEGTGGGYYITHSAEDFVDVVLDVLEDIFEDANQPPDVSNAVASTTNLWPPDHRLVDITINGVTDPNGNEVSIVITGVTQDEPTGGAPDAEGIGTSTVSLRAERDGYGNGRIYQIQFVAEDTLGAQTVGLVAVCVPHDQSRSTQCVDSGQLYSSTAP